MRRVVLVLLSVAVLVALYALAGVETTAQASRGRPLQHSMGGTWEFVNEFGGSALMVAAPTDPTNRDLILTAHVYEDPTLGGLAPEAVARTTFVGPVRQVDRNTFHFTARALGQNAAGHAVYTENISGEIVLTGCDTFVGRGAGHVVAADGTELICMPFTFRGTRVEVLPPCTELPPLPE